MAALLRQTQSRTSYPRTPPLFRQPEKQSQQQTKRATHVSSHVYVSVVREQTFLYHFKVNAQVILRLSAWLNISCPQVRAYATYQCFTLILEQGQLAILNQSTDCALHGRRRHLGE